ncbi:MAG: hypothetical protein WAT09_16765 [Paracoccaceae bacterium]
MKTSQILPGSFIAVAALLSGLAIATAQTETETAPVQAATAVQAFGAKLVDFRKGYGEREGRGMFGQLMEKVDANGDGAITQAEIDTFRVGLVTGADTSGEGSISLDEFETIYLDLTRDRMVDAFQDLDADGDGVVTQAEMDTRFGGIVDQMDRNDDGKLDREDHGGRGKDGPGRDGHRKGEHRG